jgi:hypothetical protein
LGYIIKEGSQHSGMTDQEMFQQIQKALASDLRKNVFLQVDGDNHQVVKLSTYKYSGDPLAYIYSAGYRDYHRPIDLKRSHLEELHRQVKGILRKLEEREH